MPLRTLLYALPISCLISVPTLAGSPEFAPPGFSQDLNVSASAGACAMVPYSIGSYLFFWGTTDRFASVYHRVDPADCTTCTGGAIQLNSIAYESRTVVTPSCTYRVEVAVVGVSAGACPGPDDNSVLCPPSIVDVTVLSTSGPVVVPIATDCCVVGPAYVRLRFLDDETCGSSADLHPWLRAGAEACEACDQYFTTSTAYPTVTEWCSIGVGNNFWMAVDADCCEPTSMHQHSWGRVKQIYR